MSVPFMQLYVADYLGDTRHLSTEQHGAYLLLLMSMWRSDGHLPNDDDKLARLAGLTPLRWRKIREEVMALFQVSEGRLTQKRLLGELQKAKEKSQKRSHAGHAGGVAKALKDNRTDLANATRLLQHLPEPESELKRRRKKKPVDTPSDKPTGDARKAKSGLPDDFPHDAAKKAAADYWLSKGRPDLAAGVDEQAAQFRDHHTKEGTRNFDWPATWRTWVRNALSFTRAPRTNGHQAAPALPEPIDWLWRLEAFWLGKPDDDAPKGYWHAKWGPKPGVAGCQAPSEAVTAFHRRHPGPPPQLPLLPPP